MLQRYTILLKPQPDGGYTVNVPALLGCITQGDTRDEALAMAREAITLYLEVLASEGRPYPPDVAAEMLEIAV